MNTNTLDFPLQIGQLTGYIDIEVDIDYESTAQNARFIIGDDRWGLGYFCETFGIDSEKMWTFIDEKTGEYFEND